ncbi:MAG: DUF4202 domain-containing protein [Myxococcota bacterium]
MDGDGLGGERLGAARAALFGCHDADPAGDARAYHEAVERWVVALDAEASAVVRLAAMSQHIERWTIPRAEYPMGRVGYRRWRSALSQLHARRAGEVLAAAGFDESVTARVGALLTKQRLRSDPEAGLLQDAVCLTFLERTLDGFAAGRDPAQLASILAKTWAKMTPRGQAAARALAPSLSQEAQTVLSEALAGVPD